MPMQILIDGYNLLGVREAGERPRSGMGEEQREQLIADLIRYRQRKGHSITIVFDAWMVRFASERHEYRAGVEVIYTRAGERADQVIQRLIRLYQRDCAVVTSDLEIIATAKACGAFVLTAPEFQRKLQEALGRPGYGAHPEWRRWKPMADSDDAGGLRQEKLRHKKGNPRQLPKSVRKRQRRLKGF
ncbi:MAG: hypothetical protein D6704_06260 [Nitrospirae bacterium]|nr:MAG: hypothetical protein D6704_06260 [Nitrospirota bacterium]